MNTTDTLDYQVEIKMVPVTSPPAIDPANWVEDTDIPDATYILACDAGKWLNWALGWLSGHPEHERRICNLSPGHYATNLTAARAAADALSLPYSSGDSAVQICEMIRDS